MKSEKYLQARVMIRGLIACWILLIFKKKYRLIAADLSKQNVLHAGSRAIQQIILIGKIKSTVVNKQKKQYYNFLKEQQKFCK